MKCKECKNCAGYVINLGNRGGYYICDAVNEVDFVEECVGDDENLECDLYVNNVDDDN